MLLKKQKEKEDKLLDSAYELFTKKGINDTSIKEIADSAGIGKGTFYLYFKNKYDLEEQLIARKSNKLFNKALKELNKEEIKQFDDQIIFIIDYVIEKLKKNKLLLKLIAKNLSYGIYNSNLNQKVEQELGIRNMFLKGIEEHNIKLSNPEVTLFMIIELTSSTCFSCILNKKPIAIDEYKPYLYNTIKKMLNEKNL